MILYLKASPVGRRSNRRVASLTFPIVALYPSAEAFFSSFFFILWAPQSPPTNLKFQTMTRRTRCSASHVSPTSPCWPGDVYFRRSAAEPQLSQTLSPCQRRITSPTSLRLGADVTGPALPGRCSKDDEANRWN